MNKEHLLQDPDKIFVLQNTNKNGPKCFKNSDAVDVGHQVAGQSRVKRFLEAVRSSKVSSQAWPSTLGYLGGYSKWLQHIMVGTCQTSKNTQRF